MSLPAFLANEDNRSSVRQIRWRKLRSQCVTQLKAFFWLPARPDESQRLPSTLATIALETEVLAKLVEFVDANLLEATLTDADGFTQSSTSSNAAGCAAAKRKMPAFLLSLNFEHFTSDYRRKPE